MVSSAVAQFASSLDDEDYEVASACLADDCVYESPDGEITGPSAIVDSYRTNGESGRKRFDSVVYRHEVMQLGGGWYKIEFVDELLCGQRSHVFRSNQRVRIHNGKIVHIVHEEIPGERERLDVFLQDCR